MSPRGQVFPGPPGSAVHDALGHGVLVHHARVADAAADSILKWPSSSRSTASPFGSGVYRVFGVAGFELAAEAVTGPRSR